ncbi:alpha-amylase family glycosyl hydrolase [Nocardioides agariphilus]|uniref:alpha-amylase family glycosyl hydrolase n=1 Tax=Nocardioides agariphilus TaxID=433664 RepID=UPI00351F9738
MRVLPYLHDLGVDWVYLSPILQAAAGSSHGYDVVDPSRVDSSRGGPEGLLALSTEARRLGMGVLVDIVPNHMGVATPAENAWWWDVLRLGRSSAYSAAFDIDWEAHGGRVLLPVLGDDGDRPDTALPEPAEHYELVSWRRGDAELNYRRFFTITTLAGVRVEEPWVFTESHREIGRWFAEGLVDGLRVDHPDGLLDPGAYLDDLARLTGGAYVVVEKILEPHETLPTSWATAGTTGYDVLGVIDRVLVDPAGQAPLDALESRLRGGPVSWPDLTHDTRRAVADGPLLAEVRRIARSLVDDVARANSLVEEAAPAPLVEEAAPASSLVEEGAPASSLVEEDAPAPLVPASSLVEEGAPASSLVEEDAPAPLVPAPLVEEGALAPVSKPSEPNELEDAIAEVLANFPVYRSYLPIGREHLDHALAEARSRRPDLAHTLEALAPLLADPTHPAARCFQQTSGMVMAKGVEDCAFYRYSRLTSLNEVGGDPSAYAISVAEFHDAMGHRQRDWPEALTATTTHDTKRSEDARARIAVLAEVPELWEATLDRLLDLAPLPDPGFGALLWQAVIGSWPASRERLHTYAEKAMREAGDHTAWTDPDPAYERAVHAAVDAAFDSAEVRSAVESFVAEIDEAGRSNGLAVKLLALTLPGVPDVYQGSELWDRSLADPDNRRPVDYDDRVALLADGAHPKLRVTSSALRLRRDRPELFTAYVPVLASGPAADHVVAYDRGGAVAVVTRLPLGVARGNGWGETRLDLPGRWREVISGRPVTDLVADVLRDLPVALLVQEDGRS